MKYLLTLIILITLNSVNFFAQWLSDVRLTNNSAVSNTSLNCAWNVAASGDTVHVVWGDYRNANIREIYYKHSTDGGASWGTDVRLTSFPGSGGNGYPSISVSGLFVHIVWTATHDGNFEIYHNRSTDGGITWEANTRLTNNPANSRASSVVGSGLEVHVVWRDERNGNEEIYYKRSTDGGLSWGADTRLTNNPALSLNPSLSLSAQTLHIVWYDNRDGNEEIYYKRSTDGGISWGEDTRLTNDLAFSSNPCVSSSGQNLYIVWKDGRDGNGEIYFKRSTDGGINWEADSRLTSNSTISQFPSVATSSSMVHVVWRDDRDGNGEIYYKRSSDGGINWGADLRLTINSAISQFASVSVSNSVVHVVWEDARDGNQEIYYKRDPSGNVTGIDNIGSELPEQYKLEHNYPNPFNPTTTISYHLPVNGQVTLKVYDILGKEVVTLVNEEKPSGNYEVNFDAIGLSSGVYFYRIAIHSDKLVSGNFVETKKMILMR